MIDELDDMIESDVVVELEEKRDVGRGVVVIS